MKKSIRCEDNSAKMLPSWGISRVYALSKRVKPNEQIISVNGMLMITPKDSFKRAWLTFKENIVVAIKEFRERQK